MKLKPCPSCGGEATTFAGDIDMYGSLMYGVMCKNTGCFMIPSVYPSKEQAIKAWNRREPIDRIVEQLEQLSIGTVLCDKCAYREKCDDMVEKEKDLNDDTALCAIVAKLLAIEIVKKGGAE